MTLYLESGTVVLLRLFIDVNNFFIEQLTFEKYLVFLVENLNSKHYFNVFSTRLFFFIIAF